MKKAFVLAVILTLVAVLGVGSYACKPKTPAEPTTTEGSTVKEGNTAPATTAAPAAPGVSPETYWKIQLERQEAMKAYLSETLAIYQKYNGATPEARNDLMALEKSHQEKMQAILTSNGLTSTADLMPGEPGRQEALQLRQQYMQEHPELRDKFMAMSTEMRDLKDKITAFTTSSTPPAPAPGSTAPAAGSTAPAQPPTEGAAPAPAPAAPAPDKPAQP